MNEQIKKVMAAMSATALARTSPENIEDVLAALDKRAPQQDAGDAEVPGILLWLYRRLPRGYGRPPFIEKVIQEFAAKFGVSVVDALAERDEDWPEPTMPPRDRALSAEDQGVFQKFVVYRVDGKDLPGRKHQGCFNFVLDLTHDPAAIPAIHAYAAACAVTHPQLAADLFARFGVPLELQPAGAERRRDLQDAPLPRDAEFALEHAAVVLDKAGEAEAHAHVVQVLAKHMPGAEPQAVGYVDQDDAE